MREKRSFAERAKVRSSDEVMSKYFLVYEGKETEQIYFDAVENLRGEIEINPLIELVPVIRSYSEEGWSNPKKMVDRMIKNLEENKTGCFSYETLCNWIVDYLIDEGIITVKMARKTKIWQILEEICNEDLDTHIKLDVDNLEMRCTQILSLLKEKADIKNQIEDIPKIIKNGSITYSDEVDKICFIVDRDKKSFLSKPGNNQYEYVLKKCQEKKFGFYVTNPCFELWLLMHFDEVVELDKEKLLENLYVSSDKRYTEYELRRMFAGFEKANYDAEFLVRNIDKAIKNEAMFCEDIELLESQIGSNLGRLFEELRE